MKIVLASGSPRRKELLTREGVSFTVEVSHEEEHYTKTLPYEIVMELAAQKAHAIASGQREDGIVLGADTVVAVDERILGKPADAEEACRMIRSFQGRKHQVYTGVCLISVKEGRAASEKTFYECTDVFVKPMTEEEIRSYVALGESMDAAGAYKIQGGFGPFIERFEGDRDNIIGLPVTRVVKELKEMEAL